MLCQGQASSWCCTSGQVTRDLSISFFTLPFQHRKSNWSRFSSTTTSLQCAPLSQCDHSKALIIRKMLTKGLPKKLATKLYTFNKKTVVSSY